jgi:hypothetical protein
VAEIKKILITGILEKILETGPLVIRELVPSTDFGIGERRTRYNLILVRDGSREERYRYEGVILGASLGNRVEVHEVEREEEKKIQLFDCSLNKWYL